MNKNIPFADWPNLPSEISKRSLSNSQNDMLLNFAQDGFVVVDLGLDDFDAIADKIIADLTPRYQSGHRIQDAWRISKEVKQLACNSAVLNALDLLYGRIAFPFQTLNFDVGTQQATHSDTIHFHSYPHRFMCGVWIALEDADEDNGPLHYFPGSHKLPIYTLADAGVRGSAKPGQYELYESHYEPPIREVVAANDLKAAEAYLKRGQAFIWAANLLHGGSPIRQPGRTRHSQVTHYYFEDCLYCTPLWSDPALGKIYERSPFDIAAGKLASPSYCGEKVSPPLKVKMKEIARNMLSHINSVR